jgi:site-specific recombinase XerD
MDESIHTMLDVFTEHERVTSFYEKELYVRETVEDFFVYLSSVTRRDCSLGDVTPGDYDRYRDYLEETVSVSYIKGKLAVIHRFFDFAVTMEWRDHNPWKEEESHDSE